jgi:hypothetical protein
VTRARTGIIVAAVIVIAVGAVVVGWRLATVNNNRSNMTLAQAKPIAERYAHETAARIDGSPTLAPRLVDNVIPCDQSEDHAPAGSSEVSDIYDLTFTRPANPAAVFDQLKAHWSSKGYKVISEDPATLTTRTLTVENPADGFRIGLGRGVPGNLFITVSSPCLPVGSGGRSPS